VPCIMMPVIDRDLHSEFSPPSRTRTGSGGPRRNDSAAPPDSYGLTLSLAVRLFKFK